jgi:hypothetical protein
MGIRWIATLEVSFEMEDGQPAGLPKIVLEREVGKFRLGIERGEGIARTGVKRGSANVDIVSQGPA